MAQRGRRSWPLENDDMLWEILLRLPPLPSSLPRASAVCKRWRRILADPKFHHHFRAHHRSPPFLGVFECRDFDIVFNPALDPPDRIPPQRFDLQRYSNADYNNLLDCRHGLILFEDQERQEVIVCDPITGEKHCVAVPPEYEPSFRPSTVLCAASDQGHVHGACHYNPFKVVLMYSKDNHLLVCVYSSETDTWDNHISTAAPRKIYDASYSGSLIGNTLYWLCTGNRILEFDLDGQSLPLIEAPLVANDLRNASRKIMPADNGDIGLAILSYPHFQMWKRDINYHGVMTWMLHKTIDISIILGLPPLIEGRPEEWKTIEGYIEDAIFICVGGSLYMVQLDSMQSKRLQESDNFFCYRPFTSFYAPGTIIKDGSIGETVAHHTG